jgi:mercuric ion binding protein
MRRRSTLAVFTLTAAVVVPHVSFAESRTVVLTVPDMYSPACPVVARKALQAVPGVQNVKASLERKEAVVVFDDATTTVDKLVETTKNAGFPNARVRP